MPAQGAKFRIPRPRRELVPRTRLTETLERLFNPSNPVLPRLVLVAAPAGFGKTTVLTQWLTAPAHQGPDPRHPDVAWLSLDHTDSDPRRFLGNLVEAVRTTVPHPVHGTQVGDEALGLLESDRAVVEEALVSLVNDIDSHLGPLVVVLDDYHAVDDPGVHDAVRFLIDNLPPQATVAMTTRADPPFALHRLRAAGELLEIRAADLRFTPTEATAFLNDAMGLDLSSDLVAALEERTEGWAAGLQLAALYTRDTTDAGADPTSTIAEIAGTHRFILDYLVEEVLDHQSPELRSFLLDTCVLDELGAGLCNDVTGHADGQAQLEELERRNVFVIALDDSRTQWRYHHLFADALRSRLVAADPDRAATLQRRAAAAYLRNGRVTDAVPHAIAAADDELLAALVALALPRLRKQRQDRTMRQWLDRLPAAVTRSHPVLATQTAWAHLSRGDLAAVEDWLDEAESALNRRQASPLQDLPVPADLSADLDSETAALPAMIATYRAAAAQARGDTDGTMVHARHALQLASPEDHLSRGAAAGFLGLAAWAAGDLTSAVVTFTGAVDSLQAAGNTVDALGATTVLASMHLDLGRPRDAQLLFERAISEAEAHPAAPLPVVGDLHIGLADVLLERGETERAAHHLQIAAQLGESAQLLENRYRWFAANARLQQAHGDIDQAVAMYEDAARAHLPGFYPDVRPIPARKARCLLAAGRTTEARSWAEVTPVDWDDTSYLREYEHLTVGRLLAAEARTAPAPADLAVCRERLQTLADAAAQTGRDATVLDAHLALSLLADSTGDRRPAIEHLIAALETGTAAGYHQAFLEEGEHLRDLLLQVAGSNDPAAGDARRLLAVRAPVAVPTPRLVDTIAQGRLVEALSERELEVLRLLATDLTGPEIARHLFISLNTMRTHSKHIFTKLGVNTRRAAVRRAGELALL